MKSRSKRIAALGAVVLISVLSIVALIQDAASEDGLPGCPARIPPPGKEVRIPKQPPGGKPNECHLIIMTCNYCVYSQDGILKSDGSEFCGFCVIF